MLTARRTRQVLFVVLLLSTAERVTPALAAGIIREHLRLTSSEFGILAGMAAFGFGLAQFPEATSPTSTGRCAWCVTGR